jgi:hypothetical protein
MDVAERARCASAIGSFASEASEARPFHSGCQVLSHSESAENHDQRISDSEWDFQTRLRLSLAIASNFQIHSVPNDAFSLLKFFIKFPTSDFRF